MQVNGILRVTPELTWDELKNTSYIPFEYTVMQGGNSQTTAGMRAQLKERMIETPKGDAFVKYSDSLVFDISERENLSTLAYWIEKAIQAFPGHTFEGDFTVRFSSKEGASADARITVGNSDITISTCRQVWVPRDLPDTDVMQLFRERGLAQEANRLLERVHALNPSGLHWGEHNAVTGPRECLGCDLDNFLTRKALDRELSREPF